MAITAGFGPSTLIITVGEGVTLKDIVKRGEEGEVIGFELEKHTCSSYLPSLLVVKIQF